MITILGDYFLGDIGNPGKALGFRCNHGSHAGYALLKRWRKTEAHCWEEDKKGDTTMNLRTHFHRWMQYRENIRELSGCTDRELSDLGLSRTDIHRVAREAAFA